MDDKLKRGLALHCGSGIVGSHASTEVPMPRMEVLGDLFDEHLDDMHPNPSKRIYEFDWQCQFSNNQHLHPMIATSIGAKLHKGGRASPSDLTVRIIRLDESWPLYLCQVTQVNMIHPHTHHNTVQTYYLLWFNLHPCVLIFLSSIYIYLWSIYVFLGTRGTPVHLSVILSLLDGGGSSFPHQKASTDCTECEAPHLKSLANNRQLRTLSLVVLAVILETRDAWISLPTMQQYAAICTTKWSLPWTQTYTNPCHTDGNGQILHSQRRALPQVLWLVPSPHVSALKSSKAYPVPPIFGAAPSCSPFGADLAACTNTSARWLSQHFWPWIRSETCRTSHYPSTNTSFKHNMTLPCGPFTCSKRSPKSWLRRDRPISNCNSNVLQLLVSCQYLDHHCKSFSSSKRSTDSSHFRSTSTCEAWWVKWVRMQVHTAQQSCWRHPAECQNLKRS